MKIWWIWHHSAKWDLHEQRELGGIGHRAGIHHGNPFRRLAHCIVDSSALISRESLWCSIYMCKILILNIYFTPLENVHWRQWKRCFVSIVAHKDSWGGPLMNILALSNRPLSILGDSQYHQLRLLSAFVKCRQKNLANVSMMCSSLWAHNAP